jgi:hypothetical protein
MAVIWSADNITPKNQIQSQKSYKCPKYLASIGKCMADVTLFDRVIVIVPVITRTSR